MLTYITVAHGEPFDRLLAAMEESIWENVPTADVNVFDECIPTNCMKLANIDKHRIWADAMAIAKTYEENIVLCDCDTLWLRDPSFLFEHDFDVAYTTRPGKFPINAGIVYCKPTHRAVGFIRDVAVWALELGTATGRSHWFAEELIAKYGGVGQAAFVMAMETNRYGANLMPVDCQTWNNCDQTWKRFSDKTVALHIKGKLRRRCLNESFPPERDELLAPLIRIWRRYEQAALTAIPI